MKKIWIMSGEASGDMYGAALAEELRAISASKSEKVHISGMGGAAMKNAGVEILVDSTELGVVGVVEVLKNIFTFIGIFLKLVKKARSERPDLVILIDYPGFNLRFAKKMFKAGIPVCWYVSPQVWMWGKKRIPVLAKICRKMLVIFPFEVDVYKKSGIKVDAKFVGHPLADSVAAARDASIVRQSDTLLLLPGSRKNEVDRLLKPMLDTVCELKKIHPEMKFHLSAPREKILHMCREIHRKYLMKHPDLPEITFSIGDSNFWQQRAIAGIAASGTVTVECALNDLPLVVGYKLNWFTYLLLCIFVTPFRGFYTMTNIIADKEVFPEFLQSPFCVENILPAVEDILPGGRKSAETAAGMKEVAGLLGSGSGVSAIARAAKECYEVVEEKK